MGVDVDSDEVDDGRPTYKVERGEHDAPWEVESWKSLK